VQGKEKEKLFKSSREQCIRWRI